MSATKPGEDRQVVPRWRTFRSTLSTRELHSTSPKPAKLPTPELDRLRAEFKAEKNLYVAADLLGALITNRILGDEVDEVSEYISASGRAPHLLGQSIALRRANSSDTASLDSEVNSLSVKETARADVARIRRIIKDQPRNAVARVDLALAHAILGNVSRAAREINTALALAPDNRFVLRSASRFFVHVDEPEKAHWILSISSRTQADPWLLSAELSTGQLAFGTSNNSRLARELLVSQRFSAHALSELASEVATGELLRGSDRKARKFFAQSLLEPNENAVAQAAWASDNKSLQVSSHDLTVDRGYEARAITWAQNSRWKEATDESEKWQLDQPFDLRAAMFGSYYASMGAQDYERSLSIAGLGLSTHPTDPMLHNNAAFALANLGRTEEARTHLAFLPGQEDEDFPVFLATEGLIAFRDGEEQRGRWAYRTAVEGLLKSFRRADAAAAALLWALEETRVKSAIALETRGLGERLLSASSPSPETKELLRRLDEAKGVTPVRGSEELL
jgi:tetratricopeptide (TPR) repeat protein